MTQNFFTSISTFIDHDILMRRGQWLMKCYKMNKETYNPAYISSKVCPDCGHLTPLDENNNNNNNSSDSEANLDGAMHDTNGNANSDLTGVLQESINLQTARNLTTVFCDSCNIKMEEVSPGIYYCKNGHKKALFNLINKPETEEKPETNKKTRSIKIKCPQCGKTATVEDESRIFGRLRRRYTCGHTELLPILTPPLGRDERWNDLYPFQREGVEFVENAGYSAQIGDEMGLGKTIQALSVLRYNYDELTPCLMVCESSKVYDWQNEFKTWVGDKFNEIIDESIIHPSGTYGLVPVFKNHIISMSLLQKPKVLESIKNYGFKFLIVDESHSFKNERSERSYALQQIAQVIPYKVFLSGTPIMNNVMEYFVPLNILRPSHFPSKDNLASKCDRHSSGRILGISERYRPQFFHKISEYVIRRTKKDAGIKLPKFRSQTYQVNIEGSKESAAYVKRYNQLIDELQKVMDSKRSNPSNELLGLFAQMRHVVGLAKVLPTIELVEEFIESTDSDDKITIGVHHKDVMDWLEKGLKEHNPLTISDEPPAKKMEIIEKFKTPERRILIASILGAGQGLNIQFCKNAVIAEREWNPAKEEQFCGRFHRIEKNPDGTIKSEFDDAKDSVKVDTLNVKGTIDEFMHELIELKKHVVGATLDEGFIYDPDFLMELAHKIVNARLNMKW